MKDRNEEIHRLLDGDVTAGDREAIIGRIQEDPALRKEFDDLSAAVELLEREGRVQPPLAFTASVMAKLPRGAEPFGERLKRFLFGSRVLQWNMAAAMAIVLLTVVTAIVMMRQMTRIGAGPGPAAYTAGGSNATVRLTFVAPGAKQVAVAGDFNKWRTDTHVMSRQNGMWVIDLPLQPGVYTYMFIVDSEHWVTDPHAESYRDDGFGAPNAVMRVTT